MNMVTILEVLENWNLLHLCDLDQKQLIFDEKFTSLKVFRVQICILF